MDRPILSLDRPFTYRLDAELGAGIGSLVQVPFHGRAVRGWVLGPTDDLPARMLSVRKAVSAVRFFDERGLELLRWMSERYVAPLASVIGRSYPPRVVGEEAEGGGGGGGPGPSAPVALLRRSPHSAPALATPSASPRPNTFARYRRGDEVDSSLRSGTGAFVVRPAPEDEQILAVEAVGATLAGGRTAIVLVPEADPLPETAAAVLERFGELVGLFLGGDRRARYRMWLDILGGRYRVVVGTRPAVFSPVQGLGLIWISRESHPGHREERSPYYHVRDVAMARARIESAVCVCEALCPSAEASALEDAVHVIPAARSWRKVEVVAPGPEGRAPRLVQALRSARTAFLYQPLRGYGVARVCRSCHEPAGCAACGGLLRQEGGRVRCTVCEADGRCRNCGASDFGVVRGGEERVREWASALSPGARITVGGPEAVKDVGPLGLDLVAILDADLASRRPGLAAKERALAVWMEAAALARPDGRVILQTRLTNDPAVQALVTGNPERFHRAELPRRAAAGFPVGFPVFRVAGTASLEGELQQLRPASLLGTGFGDERICLVTVRPADVGMFGTTLRRLAERGTVTRVEAEPHL